MRRGGSRPNAAAGRGCSRICIAGGGGGGWGEEGRERGWGICRREGVGTREQREEDEEKETGENEGGNKASDKRREQRENVRKKSGEERDRTPVMTWRTTVLDTEEREPHGGR